MTTSKTKNLSFNPLSRFLSAFPIATFVFFAIISLTSIISIAWCLGEPNISRFFAYLYTQQLHPPFWLTVPTSDQFYLLLPTILLLLTAQIVMKIAPRPRPWALAIVTGILLAITIRYIIWRSLTTINLSTPVNGIFSLGVWAAEVFLVASSIIILYLTPQASDRRREADQMQKLARENNYTPTVAIFIPTYNEPDFILRRTIIGCQAIDYPYKKVYLLDDTRRPEIKQLAETLGCEYINRDNNLHAKAGNLNHALKQTDSELIACFDADFVPTKNFLDRTIGFFQNQKIALLQTPQSFYNADPIARNLGLEDVLVSDEESFYRQLEPIKDGAGSVICAGTSFVVRRRSLEAIGGFVTESLCEDYFTGIKLSASGYKLIYLNEKLSAGLAAENIKQYIGQRQRWGQGTLQAFFISVNPLTIAGLNFRQRLAHLDGLMFWFSVWARLGLILMPLAYLLFGVIPLELTFSEFIYFGLPCYILNLAVYHWLSYRSRSFLLSDIYFFIQCIPLALTMLQTLINPFQQKFKVTKKGISIAKFNFNWEFAWPLFLLIGLNLIFNYQVYWSASTMRSIFTSQGLWLIGISSTYHLIMLIVSLWILIDAPKLDIYDWFKQKYPISLSDGKNSYEGMTIAISEIGAKILLKDDHFSPANHPNFNHPVTLEFISENLLVTAIINNITRPNHNDRIIEVSFTQVSLDKYRKLVEMLFCRPGQWQHREVPGEWGSILILIKSLLQPRFWRGRSDKTDHY